MEEELISFDTARLAKEKGFNIPVYKKFGSLGIVFSETDPEIHNWNEEKWNCCSAPTQSLLQKWLREKHDIHVEVTVALEFYVTVYTSHYGNTAARAFESSFGNGDKLVYEEALELGLIEALKLIKDEK